MVENPQKTLDNMIQFGSYINTNFKHFPVRALEGIQNFFGYNTMVYTILNLKPDGEVYISDIFSSQFTEERLNAYREYYFRSDPFITQIQNCIKKLDVENPQYAWHIRDLYSEKDFYESEYCNHLSETGLRYQVVLTGPKYREFPTHVISVFKSVQEGDFTQEELEILNMAGSIFNYSLGHYLKEMDHQLLITALKRSEEKRTTDLVKCGYCVFSNLTMPEETPGFSKYKRILFPKKTARDILRELTDGQDPMEVLQAEPKTIYKTCEAGVFWIRVWKDSAEVSLDKYISSFIIVEICRQPECAATEQPQSQAEQLKEKLAEYSFTAREMDVLCLLKRGYTNQRIADTLYLSLPTVKAYTGKIFKKLGVSGRSAAISKLYSELQEGT